MSSKIIEDIYHAFRRVPQPRKVVGCTHCCISEAELKSLSTDVKSAPIKAVQRLAHNGITTVGNESDYKYFLPRILHEMYLDDDFFFLCMDAFTTRIKRSGFDEWSDTERKATLVSLQLIFEKYCGSFDTVWLEDWLYGIALVDFNVSALLEILDKPENELQKLKLVLDCLPFAKRKANGDVRLSHGYLSAKQYQPIQDWLDVNSPK